MIVQTERYFKQPPDVIWPLLCNARMESKSSPWFGLGLPQPQECRLPDGQGGVGSTRQCVSDKGVIDQTIQIWDQPRHLAFKMERCEPFFKSFVSSIVDDFRLAATPDGGTKLTRSTDVQVTGRLQALKKVGLRQGLKKIHGFVFDNWERLAKEPIALPEETPAQAPDGQASGRMHQNNVRPDSFKSPDEHSR